MVLESDQRRLADVVFDPFCITFGGCLVAHEALQKCDDDPVSPEALLSERLAPLDQESRTIFLTTHEICILQARNILGHRRGLTPNRSAISTGRASPVVL